MAPPDRTHASTSRSGADSGAGPGCQQREEQEVGRTTIVLDDKLIRRAMLVSDVKTKRAVVDRALRELVARGSVYRGLQVPGASRGQGEDALGR